MSILNQASVNGNDRTEVEFEEVDETIDGEMSKEELAAFVEKVEKIIKLGEHDQKVLLVQSEIQEKYRRINSLQKKMEKKFGVWSGLGAAVGLLGAIAGIVVFRDFFTQTGTALDLLPMALVSMTGTAIAAVSGSILSAFSPESWKDDKKIEIIKNEINILRKELVEKSLDAKILTEITDFSNNWQEIVASKDGEVKGFVIRFDSDKNGFERIEQREFLVK